jgi:hypothetical protein
VGGGWFLYLLFISVYFLEGVITADPCAWGENYLHFSAEETEVQEDEATY